MAIKPWEYEGRGLQVCVAVLLAAALARWPYAYYEVLRFVVCASAVYLAWLSAKDNRILWVIALAAIALLFNPVFPIYLARKDWAGIDIVCAVLFLLCPTFSHRALNRKQPAREQNAQSKSDDKSEQAGRSSSRFAGVAFGLALLTLLLVGAGEIRQERRIQELNARVQLIDDLSRKLDAVAANNAQIQSALQADEAQLNAIKANVKQSSQTDSGSDIESPTTRDALAPAQKRQNWRKVEKGMSKASVEQLLGEPAKVENLGSLETWHYDRQQPYSATVTFNGSGQVFGWVEP